MLFILIAFELYCPNLAKLEVSKEVNLLQVSILVLQLVCLLTRGIYLCWWMSCSLKPVVSCFCYAERLIMASVAWSQGQMGGVPRRWELWKD